MWRAVVGDGPADHLVLERPAGHLEVLLRDLPCRLDGFAAAGGEEHPVEVAGGQVAQPVSELDGGRVRIGPDREVRQLGALLRRCLRELLTAVTDLYDKQRREPVEIPL